MIFPGIGGVYPLTSTIAAESCASIDRGRKMAIIFAFFGVGVFFVPFVMLLLLGVCYTQQSCVSPYCFPKSPLAKLTFYLTTQNESASSSCSCLSIIWRIALCVGALPLIMQLLTVEIRETGKPASIGNLCRELSSGHNGRRLIGTGFVWFFFDIVLYGNNLFVRFGLYLIGPPLPLFFDLTQNLILLLMPRLY